MEQGQASKTAEFVAIVRATYNYMPEGELLRDPVAADLLSDDNRRTVLDDRLRRDQHENGSLWELASSLLVLSRTRFAENGLRKAAAGSTRQYVLLGAGFDSFAFRAEGLPEDLQVFEVDFPATQAIKLERIQSRGLTARYPTHYLAVDFTRQTAADALSALPAFDPATPTYYCWLGVVLYLDKATIENTLRSLAELSASGSELVFDVVDDCLFDPSFLENNPDLAAIWDSFNRFASDRGEPILSGFSADKLQQLARNTGWRVEEIISDLQHTSRYLPGPPDFRWSGDQALLVRLKKA